MKFVFKTLSGCIAAACALASISASAAPVNYTIDTTRSFMSLDVLVDAREAGLGFIDATSAQFAGSDVAIPTGTISADRDGDADFGLIELTGSSFTYLNNATPMAPATTNGTTEPAPQPPGTDPAQWGFQTNLFGGIVGPTAMRNTQTSLTMGLQGMFLGSFDASSISFALLAAHNDSSYVGPGLPPFDIDPIDEWTGGPLPPGAEFNELLNGQLSLVGNVEELFLPIRVGVPTFAGSVPIFLLFEGEIVATRVIPEPGSIAIAALGMVGLVAAGYRRRRKA